MSRTGRFSTAMRDYARRQIEQLGNADIVVGIPSYYSDESLAHVIQMVAEGLDHFYPEKRALIIVADGGSTDDTRPLLSACLIPTSNPLSPAGCETSSIRY
jgi:hypothetical protein